MTNDIDHLFVLFGHLYIFSGEMSNKVLSHFLIVLFAFYCRIIRIFNIFWVLDLYQIHDLNIFSLIL